MLPRQVDTLILGGGTTGCVIAGLLAERSDESILVLEAGPDPGPLAGGGWPANLLNGGMLATDSHDWGYTTGLRRGSRELRLERARVIGGCSSHNGCAAIWGHRADYDAWAARGCEGWSTDELLPSFAAANARLRVRQPPRSELTPFQAAVHDALVAWGVPATEDLNDLDEAVGVSVSPVNIDGTVRFNTAFAYLDPVRHRPGLTIVGDVLVDHLLLDGTRVTGASVIVDGRHTQVLAERTIVAGGAFGSPAILERSGIGDEAVLARAGVPVRHVLPGVGANLHDHPALDIFYHGTPALVAAMRARAAEGFCPEEQVIAKVRSALCEEAFDLHVYPVGGPDREDASRGYFFELPVALMTPRSRGTCHVRSRSSADAPAIDYRFLTDPDGRDAAVLRSGIEIVRDLVRQGPLAAVLDGVSYEPGDDLSQEWVHYYHPVGTCAMGPASDPGAVVDPRGRIHGLEGAYVADCSIIPVIPRANTNVTAVMIGERIANWLN
jgi:choline dehydrogenase